jgi:DNA-binding response OmpR family regulator
MVHVILIDDDRDDSELFAEALGEINAQVEFTYYDSAREALTALDEINERPDLIFLDINLPLMSGWELLTHLKKTEHLAGIPVIMYTTSSHDGEKEMSNILGAADFITKPNDFNELKETIRLMIGKHHAN